MVKIPMAIGKVAHVQAVYGKSAYEAESLAEQFLDVLSEESDPRFFARILERIEIFQENAKNGKR